MPKKKSSSSFLIKIKSYFISGLGVLFPLFITAYLIVLVFQFTHYILGRHVNSFLLSYYNFTVPGIGFILVVCIIFIAGYLSRQFIGRWFFPFLERIFLKIPLIARIYPSSKQLSNFLFGEKKDKFQKVVLVEYPEPGCYSIGFITNKELSKLDKAIDNNLIAVLAPLSPAPFSGILLILPRDKIKVIDMSIENAIKFVVSGGVVAPEIS